VTVLSEDERRRHVDAVLAERARVLAQPVTKVNVVPMVELVQFRSGNERYAIESAYVRRAERLGAVTPLPGAARHFAGIANLHGQIVPLIDLRLLLGTTPTEEVTFGIVLGEERAEVALVAEALLDIRLLPVDTLGPLLATRTLVRHILPDGAAVIDGAALIADPRLVVGTIVPDATHEENTR
jgi:purine-binding chemotaxis protein CheW